MKISCACGNVFGAHEDAWGVFYCDVCEMHRSVQDAGVAQVNETMDEHMAGKYSTSASDRTLERSSMIDVQLETSELGTVTLVVSREHDGPEVMRVSLELEQATTLGNQMVAAVTQLRARPMELHLSVNPDGRLSLWDSERKAMDGKEDGETTFSITLTPEQHALVRSKQARSRHPLRMSK